MPQHDLEEFPTDAALKAHLGGLHPDWDFLGEGMAPGAVHYSLHLGEFSHRAVATHLIEGHGYSVQTVRGNPSPQLTIEHVRLHADEFAAGNQSAWNHSHEPPKLWEPEVHPEDVIGRVVAVKINRADRWKYDGGIELLRQAGANVVLLMDRYDTLETLDDRQMRQAGWIRASEIERVAEQLEKSVLSYGIARTLYELIGKAAPGESGNGS